MTATLVIESPSTQQFYDSIACEKSFTERSQVSIKLEKNRLVVEIRAKDFNALRAAANSYLRMLGAAQDTLKVLP